MIYLLPQSIFNSLCDLLKRVLQLLDMTRRSRHGQAQEFGLSLWTGDSSMLPIEPLTFTTPFFVHLHLLGR